MFFFRTTEAIFSSLKDCFVVIKSIPPRNDTRFFWLLPLVLVLSSCQQAPNERHYTEIIVEAPQQSAPDPHVGLDMSSKNMPAMEENNLLNSSVTWIRPAGWQEIPGQGMRLVSFHLIQKPEAIDCSIVSLGGMAGGLEANLRRWLGQLNLSPSPEDFRRLMASREIIPIEAGLEANIYDLTLAQKAASGSDKSIIVAMITMKEATVFVKMTGKVDDIKRHRKSFLELVRSVKAS